MAGSELLQGQSEVFFNTPPIPPPLSTFARAEGGAAFCLGCPATGQPGAAEICYWLGKNACDEFRAPGTARWSKLMLRSEVEGVRLFRRWRAAASRSRRERVNRGQKPDEAPPFRPAGRERGWGSEWGKRIQRSCNTTEPIHQQWLGNPRRYPVRQAQCERIFARRRAIDWLCSWQMRDSVTFITAAISLRFMSCS